MGRKVPMRYDSKHERWYVELQGRSYGLHCGEQMEIYIGGQPVLCRLELDRNWYVNLKDACFNLRPSTSYLVNV